MFSLYPHTLASARTPSGTNVTLFLDSNNKLQGKNASGQAVNVITEPSNQGQQTQQPVAETFQAEVTAARALVAGDVGKILPYNSETNGVFNVPDDATLGVTGSDAVTIKLLQLGTGRVDIAAAGAGVTLNKSTDYPSSTQYVIQTIQRVAANTWIFV